MLLSIVSTSSNYQSIESDECNGYSSNHSRICFIGRPCITSPGRIGITSDDSELGIGNSSDFVNFSEGSKLAEFKKTFDLLNLSEKVKYNLTLKIQSLRWYRPFCFYKYVLFGFQKFVVENCINYIFI